MQSPDRYLSRGFAVMLGMWISVTACGSPAQKESETAFSTWDSAGVAIAQTSSSKGRASIGWSISDVPEMQIGQATGELPYQFSNIVGVRELAGGDLLVVDGSSGELRYFGPEGDFLYSRGRRGTGPGEFEAPRLLNEMSGDSLLFFDTRLRRFSLFSSDGNGHRSFPGYDFPSALVAGNVYGVVSIHAVVQSSTFVESREQGPLTMPISVKWVGLESQTVDTLAVVDFPHYRTSFQDMSYLLDVPFGYRPTVAIGEDRFWVTTAGGPGVLEYNEAGQLSRIFRIDESPRPVQREDIDAVTEFLASRSSTPEAEAFIRTSYQQMDFPSGWPSFQALLVDEAGWLWAEVYRPVRTSDAVWIVFDETGEAHGSIVMPEGLEVRQIGSDFILGRWLDDLGVEYVRRYSLSRSTASPQ